MKRIKFTRFASLFVAAALISGCGGLDKMKETANLVKFTAEPAVLEMHANEVEVTFNGNFPPKYMNKKVELTVTPVLVWDGGEAAFKSKTLQGEDVQANNQAISYLNGGTFSYTDKIPYQKGMRVSKLEYRLQAKMGENTLDFPAVKVADGVIETPLLVQNNPKPILMTDKFQRVIPDSKKADIHFVINQANLRNSELRAEDVAALKEFLKAAQENERIKIKNTEVSAYASPDGEVDLNTKLAGKRENVAGNYFKKELKKADVEMVNEEGFITLKNTPEDWEGFKALMEKSEIQDKELILRVLSMYSDPVVREKEIKNISSAYVEIADQILPELRRSILSVNIEKIGYSDEELVELVKSNPDTLNIEEMLYAATLFEDNNEKLAIYTKASEAHPACLRAINNVGYANIKLNKLAEAKVALEKAKEMKSDNPIVLNNLGVVAMMEGDVALAEEYFNAATDAGAEVSYNLGIINIIKGEYKTAVTYFKDDVSFNAALAMLLADQTGAADKTLDALGENAMAYYLKAVIAARAQRENEVFDYLRNAVGMDSKLAGMAKTDLEFFRYFENDVFKSVVQ